MVSLRAFAAAALLVAGVPLAVLASSEGQQAVSAAIENHCGILSNVTSSAHSLENTLRPRMVVSSPPVFISEPSSPDVPFVKIFNNAADFQTQRQRLEENTIDPMIMVVNTDNTPMRFEFQLTYSAINIHGHKVQPEGNPHGGRNLLLPGQVAVVGNIPEASSRPPGNEKYIGAIRAQFCDGNGDNVIGHVDHSNKSEWNITPVNTININHSMVDGFNMPANIAFSNANSENKCMPLHCCIPASTIASLCPPSNLAGTDEHPICISDCKITGSAQDCCALPDFDNMSCPASNMYLKEACEFTYAYAHDDAMYQGKCDLGRYVVWSLGNGQRDQIVFS